MIPKQLKKLKFCRIKRGSKAPFEKNWNNKPYSYEEISKYFPKENYGVLCGCNNLAVIDCDKKELSLAVEQTLPKTFSVKTGSGGKHFYYFIPDLKKKIILNAGEEHLGEIQSKGTQVVGAGSLHPSGNKYEVIDDIEIKEISLKDIEKNFKQFIKNERAEVDEKDIEDYENLINEIVKVWKEGDRQELALSISGYLRKEKRLGAKKVQEIIKKVCEITKDNEIDMRLRAVVETYKKDEKDIKGFTGLGKVNIEKGISLTEKQIKEDLKERFPKIIELLKEYLDLKEEYYQVIALWILGTHVHKIFRTYPYLYLNAMKGSGKSRALGLISFLSRNGKVAVSMSEAVLFRTAKDSTICIDEFEKVRGKESANLRELLNAAYKKGISVERAKKVITKGGEGYTIEKFDVFCPIAMANISGMDEVLGDRSIKLTLERSSNPAISRKLEIWDLNYTFSSKYYTNPEKPKFGLLRLLGGKSVYSSVELDTLERYIEELYKSWNEHLSLINNNNTYYIEDTTLHQTTPLFDKILKSSLNGRHLELFFPLFIIANFCDVLDSTIEIAEKIIEEKKEQDVYENRDVSLIDFISQQKCYGEWIVQKRLLQNFKEFLEVDDKGEDKWLNSQWFGIALSRLKLLKDRRRVGRGVEVILNIEKAKEKIKMFK